MSIITKVLVGLLALLLAGGAISSFFNSKKLIDAMQKLDSANVHLDTAMLRIKSAESTVATLQDSLNSYNDFLESSRKAANKIGANLDTRTSALNSASKKFKSEIEQIAEDMKKINVPKEDEKINVTDK